ncbi:hypothetical protein EXIGLDRAFT_728571 [Exidia glandulosa HHB12029]|uniref:Lysine-specific metallo-endopeptidase domain-containing protein n=1 Tax=Exidia glandulosa HHB12029 TaxID=1314781 RepID=A0A165Q3N0_EXIGL|nr:hypothetical protein EXIGLDRAFT_728571 [Exidia glandulosa HHB12029]
MHSRVLHVVGLVAAVTAQALDKPTLYSDGLPMSDYADGLQQVSATFRAVGPPDKCVEEAMGNNACDEGDVEAREVTYGDCEQPWILCRCSNANMSMDDIMTKFSYVPPGIRSYVGGLIALQAPAASAYIAGNFIVFNSDCVIPVFIHESSHALDSGVSGSSEWKNAVNTSACVPDYYANSNLIEDFAQVSVVYTYLSKHNTAKADTTCLDPQLDVFRQSERLTLAQKTTTCLPDKRPFTLEASSRPAIGDSGSTTPATATPAISRSTAFGSASATIPAGSTSPGSASETSTDVTSTQTDIPGAGLQRTTAVWSWTVVTVSSLWVISLY